MIDHKKVCVILPAYNAARTLERTVGEIPMDLVDDASHDDSAAIAARLGLGVLQTALAFRAHRLGLIDSALFRR